MTAATSRLRRRGIGAGVAALVGLGSVAGLAGVAQAAAGFDPSSASAQLAGVDRFDTAAKIARAAFTTAGTVVVANGDRVIDAQAAGYIAGVNNAPILLTRAGDVPTTTLDAIKALGATRAIVIGDDVSVSAAARAQMTAAGLTLTSIAGDNRFDTAADIYNTPATKAKTVFIARGDYATGQVSPDALAAGPISYKSGIPILLTNIDTLPAETRAALVGGGVTKVVYLGNGISQAVKDAVAAAIPTATAETIAGADRSLTAQALANSSYGTAVYNKTSASIANGERVDALAAGPLAAIKGTPILLTLGTNTLGTGTTGYLDANKATLTTATVFGSSASVPASFLTQAKTSGGGDVANLGTIAVAPTTAATLTATATQESPNVTTDDRTYTVTGLTDATQYRVTLVNAANVTTTAGTPTFAIDRTAATVTSTNPDGANGQQASGNYLAAAGTVATRFLSVNGAAAVNNTGVGTADITGGSVTNSAVANPVNGSLTFTIDANTPESVVPVVYVNGGAGLALTAGGPSFRLELNASGVPVESFGLGGVTLYTLTQAGLGTISSVTVASADTTNNVFSTSTASYFYDSGDTFQYGGQPLTLEAFEAAIGAGAVVSGSYATTAAGTSTFNITTAATVTAVGAPTASVINADGGATANDVRVVYTRPSNASGVTYKLQRAVVSGGVTGTYADVTATDAPTPNAATYTYTLNNTADNASGETYVYRVQAIAPVTGTATNGTVSNAITVPGASDTTAPVAVDTIQTTAAGFNGSLDQGDVFKIVYSEPVAAPAAGSLLRLGDGDGSVSSLVVGNNVTVARNASTETVNGVARAAGTVFTVTLTGAPTVVNPGTVTGVQFPATILDESGFADLAGNAWIPSSTNQDVVIEAVGADTVPATAAATISSVAPSSGSTAGGTNFTLTGAGFLGATGVTVGGAAATSFTVVSDTSITGTAPAGTAGPRNVVVLHPNGNGTSAGGFTYTAPASITSISPTSGGVAGGTSITITGTGFLGATGVTIGGAAATAVTVVSDTSITATTPAGTDGAQNVVVLDPAGNGTSAGGFTYTAPSSITSISPNTGFAAGGDPITIAGTGFLGSTGVTIGGAPATAVTVVSDTSITATTPAGTVGAQNVVVIDSAGNGTSPGGFTYQ